MCLRVFVGRERECEGDRVRSTMRKGEGVQKKTMRRKSERDWCIGVELNPNTVFGFTEIFKHYLCLGEINK